MNLAPLLFGAGAIGPFASRVFLPAFLTALLLRFGPHVDWVQHLGILNHMSRRPTWFTSDACLIVLGVLAALETFGQKQPEVRRLFHELDLYLKPALALLTMAGVMNGMDAQFVTQTVHQAGVVDGLLPVGVALATWRVAKARQPVAAAIFDHLEGTHLDHLLSWAEDAWATLGPVLLVLFPIAMLVLTGAAVAVVMVVRRQLARAERAARLPCPQCGTLVYPCALACQTCRRPVDAPVAVGFLGLSKSYPAPNPAAQPFNLAERRRCPVCAAHLPAGRPRVPCATCGDTSRTTASFANAYVAHVGWRLPRVFTVTFLLGLIPVVGLLAGTVYYRSVIVLPFAEYLPPGRRFLLRWGVRLLFLVLAICQVIPLLGAFVVPAMAAISFEAYRRAFLATMIDPARSGEAVATALAV